MITTSPPAQDIDETIDVNEKENVKQDWLPVILSGNRYYMYLDYTQRGAFAVISLSPSGDYKHLQICSGWCSQATILPLDIVTVI